jgi:hypothetical protein
MKKQYRPHSTGKTGLSLNCKIFGRFSMRIEYQRVTLIQHLLNGVLDANIAAESAARDQTVYNRLRENPQPPECQWFLVGFMGYFQVISQQ